MKKLFAVMFVLLAVTAGWGLETDGKYIVPDNTTE